MGEVEKPRDRLNKKYAVITESPGKDAYPVRTVTQPWFYTEVD
jgi:hypothetical protein